MKNELIIERVLRYLLGAVLLVSGISKMIYPLTMIETIKALDLFPESIGIFLSSIIPIVEVALSISLFLNYRKIFLKRIVLILFIIFLLVSIYGYKIGLKNDCGCFGNLAGSKFGIKMIIRNLLFLIIATGYYKIYPRGKIQ